MSDSFNSPNQLSLETYKESQAPEPNVPAVNAQQAVAVSTSVLEKFENYFHDLASVDSAANESISEEEVSFEVIADYVEAEVSATISTPSEFDRDSISVEGELEETPTEADFDFIEAFDDIDAAESHSENAEATSSKEEKQTIESLTTPSEHAVPNEMGEVPFEALDDSSQDPTETDGGSVAALDQEGLEEEEVSELFDASVEIVDVEILESQEQERSYEVHHDGTLTYFQYFLDEEESVFGPGNGDWRSDAKSSPRSLVSATAVGVGVLAATLGAGLLMAEATNRNSISDNQKDSSETRAKADSERKASEASELAKASSPETTTPDWSATQKALAVSQGSTSANPSLGSLIKSPSASSVTSKLAPLAQPWGTSIQMPPPPTLTTASIPIIPTASLPTPTTAPVDLSTLRSVPSYQVIQPQGPTTVSSSLPSPPSVATIEQDEQQLRSRLDALRDRMADPIDSNTVPVTTDGSLLSGTDERWVGNIPQRVNAPIDQDGTTVNGAFESPQIPNLTDSPYSSPAMGDTPAAMPSSSASVNTAAPSSVAAAPQIDPLDLNSVSSLNATIVAPVAGLLPTMVVPAQVEPLPPRASAMPPSAVEQLLQTASSAPAAVAIQDRSTMNVTPGAIALEVIPPALSTPVLTAPVASNAAITKTTEIAAVRASTQPVSNTTALAARPAQGITSLTELAGIQSPLPLALSRDTARAALNNAEQLKQFRVLPLTVSEYQRLWQESGNDGTFAPVHGFVDYGQNVIAVVVPRSDVNGMGAAAEKDASLQPISEAPEIEATEVSVSAKPAVPVKVMSQS